MNTLLRPSSIGPYLAAVLVATVWGAVVQTQYNLAGLASIGADISGGVRAGATLSDIFSGFTPTYASHIVMPSLLVAFLITSFIPTQQRGARLLWFAAAGVLALAAGIPIVNWLAPVALLVGATRDISCTLVMAIGGLLAGLLFAAMTQPRLSRDRYEQPKRVPMGSPT